MTAPGATTIRKALAEAERASLEAAYQAVRTGTIRQLPVGPGVWRLAPQEPDES